METVATVCGYCGVGCGMDLHVVDGVVKKATGRADHPANRGRLCTTGSTTADMLRAGGRLTTALVRSERSAEAAPTGVDAAVDMVAARLSAIRDEHGSDAIALYVSGQMSIEAQYLANKLAKGYLRTQWIESNSRLCPHRGAVAEARQYPRRTTAGLFDVLHDRFRQQRDYDGCSFIKVLLEMGATHPAGQASIAYLANLRAIIRQRALAAELLNTDEFARSFHILIKGAIIAATEGDSEAAPRAQSMARLLIERHRCAPLSPHVEEQGRFCST